MAQANCKPPHSRDPPWGAYSGPGTYASVSASTFVRSPPRKPPEKIVPRHQHVWGDGAETPFAGTSSTHDQFKGPTQPALKPYKPVNNWSPPNEETIFSTTASTAFQPFGRVAVATPFRPREQDKIDTPMELRTTQREHYPLFTEQFLKDSRREPFRPKLPPRDNEPFLHTSSSRSHFVPYNVKPYVPAPKPKGQLGTEGGYGGMN